MPLCDRGGYGQSEACLTAQPDCLAIVYMHDSSKYHGGHIIEGFPSAEFVSESTRTWHRAIEPILNQGYSVEIIITILWISSLGYGPGVRGKGVLVVLPGRKKS